VENTYFEMRRLGGLKRATVNHDLGPRTYQAIDGLFPS
jgi:hypothetical protein